MLRSLGMTWVLTVLLNAGALAEDAPIKCQQQLRTECQAVIDVAVRRPYGWGLQERLDEVPPAKGRSTVVVAMDRGESAAAGLVLLWSGELIKEPAFADAAAQIARGAIASQERTGEIERRPTFGTSNGGGQGPPSYVPPRGATIAGFALLLAELDSPKNPDEHQAMTRSAAVRASSWLLKQEARNGAWPSAFPPDASPRDAVKLQRLDDPVAVRDSTFALLLAGEALNLETAGDGARRTLDLLLRLRLSRPPSCADLWASAYTIDGSLVPELYCFPDGADLVASKHALQLLTGAYLLSGEKSYVDPIERAAKAIDSLKDEDGKWTRFPSPGPKKVPSTQSERPGATSEPAIAMPREPAEYGLVEVVAAAKRVGLISREKELAKMNETFSSRRRLTALIAGLSDDGLWDDWPKNADEANAFVEEHPAWFNRIGGHPPAVLADEVNRLWALYARAWIEKRFGV